MLDTIITEAQSALPRSQYARDVIAGRQRWSGADLTGKAKRYGASYATQRNRARTALHRAGGLILEINNGLLVTAARAGADDYGNAIFHTTHGVAVQLSANRARLA